MPPICIWLEPKQDPQRSSMPYKHNMNIWNPNNFLHAILLSIVSASRPLLFHVTNQFQLERKRAVISGGLLTRIVSSFPVIIRTIHIQMGKGSASCPQVHYPRGPLKRESVCVWAARKQFLPSSCLSSAQPPHSSAEVFKPKHMGLRLGLREVYAC